MKFLLLLLFYGVGLFSASIVKELPKIPQNDTSSGIDDDTKMQKFILGKVDKVDSELSQFVRQYVQSDFSLYAYKTNYLLPFSYSSKSYDYWHENGIDDLNPTYDKKYETEFQISLKRPLMFNFLGLHEILVAAYTQKVWWQIYSPSSPFRETNYEPELFVTFPTPHDIDQKSGLKGIRFGMVHESNGRGGKQSRSWNRIYISSIWQRDKLFANLRIWHRLAEKKGEDDNPDITDYMGYGDFSLSYIIGKSQIGVVVRNNFDFKDNKGALMVDFSMPLPNAKDTFWYMKFFDGYGESLIDYNRNITKFAIGFSFSRGLF